MATLRSLVESAFVDYLNDQSLAATVHAGIGATDKAAPAVIVRLTQAVEEPFKSGNYKATVEITCKSVAADDAGEHEALCLAVKEAVWRDDIETQLQTAQPGLRVFGGSAPHQIAYDTDGDCWTETQTVEIYCCAYQFTA
jgi:hypothetical protein